MAARAKNPKVRIKRAYLPPSPQDGVRVLVDRLWPRGLRKADAAIGHWLKDVAPSDALRRWFGHDPDRWSEFRRRYKAELKRNRAALKQLREIAARRRLTLVFSAHDEAHNQAVVLKEILTR